jgi:hypothetical protein
MEQVSMEIQPRFRYRYYRHKKGWRVAASAIESPDGWLEFTTYQGATGRTRQWRKQTLHPVRGWVDVSSVNDSPAPQGRRDWNRSITAQDSRPKNLFSVPKKDYRF